MHSLEFDQTIFLFSTLIDHPNRDQFHQYQQQWMTYQKQMDEKRSDIMRRKQMLYQEQSPTSSAQDQFGGPPRGPSPRGRGINQTPEPRGVQANRGGRPDFRPRGPQHQMNQFRPQINRNQGPMGNFNSSFQGMNEEEDYEEKGMDLDEDEEYEEEGVHMMNQFTPRVPNASGPRGPRPLGGNNKFGGQEHQNFGRGMARGQRPPRGRGGRGGPWSGMGRGGGPMPLMSMDFTDENQGEEFYEEQEGTEEEFDNSFNRNPNNVPSGQARGGPRFGFNRGQGDPQYRFQRNDPHQQNFKPGFNTPNQNPRFGGRNMQSPGPRFGFPGNQNPQRDGWSGHQDDANSRQRDGWSGQDDANSRQQPWLQKHLHGGGGNHPQSMTDINQEMKLETTEG